MLLVAVVASGCSSASGRAGRAPQGTPTSAPTSGTFTGPAAPAGQNPLGTKFDYKRVDSFAPYLKNLAGGATFYELVWCDVQPAAGAVPDWSAPDQAANSARQFGLTIYLKIRVGSCELTGGRGQHVRGQKQKTESLMPTDLGQYDQFVRATVARYSKLGVHEYAVENEINSDTMWAGTPADYVRLLTVAAKAIRASDPSARVVDPGISSTAYGVAIADRLLSSGHDAEALAAYQHYYTRRTTRGSDFPAAQDVAGLRSALGTDQARRNLAFLSAVNRLAADHVVDVRQLHFYEQWDSVPALLDYVHATLPANFPLEAWEVGMFWQDGTADPQARAGELIKSVALLLAGGVRRVIWLPLAADPTGRNADEPRYGLVDPNGTVRATGTALQALVSATRGASVQSVNRPGVRGVAFGHGASSTLVVWSDQGTTLPGSAPVGVVAENVGGSRVDWGGGGLRLGAQPLMVVVPQPLTAAVGTVLS